MSKYLILEASSKAMDGKGFNELKQVGNTKDNIIVDERNKNWWYSSTSATKIATSIIQLKNRYSPIKLKLDGSKR